MEAHSKSLMIWSLSMIALVAVGMMKFEALSTDTQALEALMKQFPASIQAVFGMTGLDLATVSGYYGILYLYLAVLVAIHAGLLGEELFTKEERDKTTEFLYVRPVSRPGVITAKLCAGFCGIALINIVTMVSSYVSISGFVDPASVREELLLFTAALAITQLVFFSLGALFASLFKSSKLPSLAISLLIFVCYLMFVFYKLSPDISVLRYLSIFTYFDASTLLASMNLELEYVIICAVIVVVCALGTYVFYRKRDFSI